MTISNTRFWIDRGARHIGIRSSNRANDTQPFEFSASRGISLFPSLYLYEDNDDGGREIRLSATWLWFSLNILLFLCSENNQPHWEESSRRWGWRVDGGRSIWAQWGTPCVNFDFPFINWMHQKTEMMNRTREDVICDTHFKLGDGSYEKIEETRKRHSVTLPYRYECLDGNIQDISATVSIERSTRRAKWTPFQKIEDHIAVTFSEEVGPARGSWKGGCTGCWFKMKPKENIVQCLRRMERDRRFER